MIPLPPITPNRNELIGRAALAIALWRRTEAGQYTDAIRADLAEAEACLRAVVPGLLDDPPSSVVVPYGLSEEVVAPFEARGYRRNDLVYWYGCIINMLLLSKVDKRTQEVWWQINRQNCEEEDARRHEEWIASLPDEARARVLADREVYKASIARENDAALAKRGARGRKTKKTQELAKS